ncbi:MAG: hypothetical protein ACI4MS_07690 [Candidatus Coproplasma sp.]
MTFDKVITVSLSVLGFLITVLIPTIVVMVNKVKALKTAKTESERLTIMNELLSEARNAVIKAEELYKDTDAVLKAQGKSSGALKKDKVMTELHQLCFEKGIAFDESYWSEEIEHIVSTTKQVNAAK